MGFTEFIKQAHSFKGFPSANRLQSSYVIVVLSIILSMGFYRVCNDPILKDTIVPYAWIIATVIMAALGAKIAQSFSESKQLPPIESNPPQSADTTTKVSE